MCTSAFVQASSRMWRPDGCARAAEVPRRGQYLSHNSLLAVYLQRRARLSEQRESKGEVAERLKAAVC